MRRQRALEEPAHQDRWLVSYADFITLMFGLFVVMYSVSSVNDGKYRVLSDSLEQVFRSVDAGIAPQGAGLEPGSPAFGVFEPGGAPIGEAGSAAALAQLEAAAGERAALAAATSPAARQAALAQLSRRDDVTVRELGDRIEVALDDALLFASGAARIRPAGLELLAEVAGAVAGAPALRVEGHTDDRPIANLRFGSNWELSAARAASVVEELAALGLPPERMAALGFGEFRPIADNGTAEGRASNRRVVIVAGADDPAFQNAIDSAAVRAEPVVGPDGLALQRVLQLPGPKVPR